MREHHVTLNQLVFRADFF